MSYFPPPPSDKAALEEGEAFSPRFDRDGLVTAIVTDVGDGVLLMVAHMNEEALRLTLETGVAHFWSRSRAKLWKKGETSGNLLQVVEVMTDCDQDAVWLKVTVGGHDATCHTGRRSCFYRSVRIEDGKARLANDGSGARFDPDAIYGGEKRTPE